MHLGNDGRHHGHRMAAQKANEHGAWAAGTRGERLVARLDSDGDAKLGIAELEGTRFGKKMTVDRFARLDANRDGALDAGEIDLRQNRGSVPESVLLARMADFLTEKTEPRVDPLTTEVLRRLDGDQDGTLSKEEMAGTRLGDAIGEGFSIFDADENAVLDAAELKTFIETEILGLTQPYRPQEASEVAVPAVSDDVGGETPARNVASAVSSPEQSDESRITLEPAIAGDVVTEGYDTPGVSPDTASLASLEAALATLKANPSPVTALDAIGAFYQQVRGILDAA